MAEVIRSSAIVVDRSACMGSGVCVVYAPRTFAHDDETKAVVLDPVGDPAEQVQHAIEACPTEALSWSASQEQAPDDV